MALSESLKLVPVDWSKTPEKLGTISLQPRKETIHQLFTNGGFTSYACRMSKRFGQWGLFPTNALDLFSLLSLSFSDCSDQENWFYYILQPFLILLVFSFFTLSVEMTFVFAFPVPNILQRMDATLLGLFSNIFLSTSHCLLLISQAWAAFC